MSGSPLSALMTRLGIQQTPSHAPAQNEWNVDLLAGRFAELSSEGETACMSAAVSIILEAQHRGEPSAWIAAGPSTFFPPDAAASGIDLDALPIVRTKNALQAARTADWLLRSGAFAVVVLDLGHDCNIRIPIQSRLAGLAKKHHTALLCLTKKRSGAPSIGSLVSIRGQAGLKKTGFDRFAWAVHIIKDKRKGPGWIYESQSRGPDGLC